MNNTIEIPLDLPDVKLQTVEINQTGDFIITVSSTCEGTRCHRCGREITKPLYLLILFPIAITRPTISCPGTNGY
jgi:hypothetical protein